MASLYPENSKKVAYKCLVKQNLSIFKSPLSNLEDVLELPDLPCDDQED